MEGGDKIFRKARHREGNGTCVMRQQKVDLAGKRKETAGHRKGTELRTVGMGTNDNKTQ